MTAGTRLTMSPRYGTRLNTPATAPTRPAYGNPSAKRPSHVRTPTMAAARTCPRMKRDSSSSYSDRNASHSSRRESGSSPRSRARIVS